MILLPGIGAAAERGLVQVGDRLYLIQFEAACPAIGVPAFEGQEPVRRLGVDDHPIHRNVERFSHVGGDIPNSDGRTEHLQGGGRRGLLKVREDAFSLAIPRFLHEPDTAVLPPLSDLPLASEGVAVAHLPIDEVHEPGPFAGTEPIDRPSRPEVQVAGLALEHSDGALFYLGGRRFDNAALQRARRCIGVAGIHSDMPRPPIRMRRIVLRAGQCEQNVSRQQVLGRDVHHQVGILIDMDEHIEEGEVRHLDGRVLRASSRPTTTPRSQLVCSAPALRSGANAVETQTCICDSPKGRSR